MSRVPLRRAFPMDSYEVHVSLKEVREVAADGTICFIGESLTAEPLPEAYRSAETRMFEILQGLRESPVGTPHILAAERDPGPLWGEMMFLYDPPDLSWRELIRMALDNAHRQGYRRVCILLDRMSDRLRGCCNAARLRTIATDIRNATKGFYDDHIGKDPPPVLIFAAPHQSDFVVVLRDVWSETMEHRRQGVDPTLN